MLKKIECKPFMLSPPFCLHNGAVVLKSKENTVTFGLLNKSDEQLRCRLEKAARAESKSAEFEYVTRAVLERYVSRMYGTCSTENKKNEEAQVPFFNDDVASDAVTDFSEKQESRAAVVLLDSLLEEAKTRGATDIHIQENIVRFRVNGLLENQIVLLPQRASELVQRIKLLAKLNVLEHRRGQDGQFTVKGVHPLFVRVSCIPAVSSLAKEECESVVLRLLDPERVPLSIGKLGFSEQQQNRVSSLALKENGLLLVCGPTGAGKSTTAAAIINHIVKTSECTKKIITIEDPPEYILPGVTQVQVNEQTGISFSEALRRIFRQDPDVILIGEIRDSETAHIAMQAALTGHLVIATLHTSGFAETILRLEDLGIETRFSAQIIRGIIIQKLIHEKDEIHLSASVLAMNSMTTDVVINNKNKVVVESCLKGASI